MLHHVGLIRLLQRLGDQIASDVSAVDKVILVVAVSARNKRFSDKSGDLDILRLHLNRKQVCEHFSSVHRVGEVAQAVISGGAELVLIVLDHKEGTVRAGNRARGRGDRGTESG